jgi:hypothetical protein
MDYFEYRETFDNVVPEKVVGKKADEVKSADATSSN